MGLKINISKEEPKKTPKNKKKLEFSQKLIILVLLQSLLVSISTLYLCYLCIINTYDGGLPFLVALVGAAVIGTNVDVWKLLEKSQKQNSQGGITYDVAMKEIDKTMTDSDSLEV